MPDRRYSNEDDHSEKGGISIGVFLAILVSLAFLVAAGFLGNYFLREYFSPEKQNVQAQTQEQTTEKKSVSANTAAKAENTGEVLNIYGEPLSEPKPKYIPETETEANGKSAGKSKKDDKAIYLEAVDNSNVHTEAGQDYPSVDVTEVGEKCKYLGENEYGWLLIKTEDGNEGYVFYTHFANAEQVTD